MPVEHAAHIGGQFELDRPLVLHVLLGKDQKHTAVPRPVQVPLQVDAGEVADPDRAGEKKGDGKGVLPGACGVGGQFGSTSICVLSNEKQTALIASMLPFQNQSVILLPASLTPC